MTSRICITDKDHLTLQHIEEFGSITINQCKKLFYNVQIYGYDIARKRLNKLCKYGKLKVVRDYTSNQNLYYIDKKLSYHDLLVMDFYSKLVSCGAKIIAYGDNITDSKPKRYWLDNKLISDGFIAYSIENTLFFNIVEVVKTHTPELDKYKKLYESYEAHKTCDDIYKSIGGKNSLNTFPRLIIIDNVQHKEPFYINDDIDIIQLDFQLNEFAKIFLN